jgi:hypothetical protein
MMLELFPQSQNRHFVTHLLGSFTYQIREKQMEKIRASEFSSNQEQNVTEVSLLPYSAPELHVYNQAKTTMGGVVGGFLSDSVGPFTSYKVS